MSVTEPLLLLVPKARYAALGARGLQPRTLPLAKVKARESTVHHIISKCPAILADIGGD